MNKVDETRKLTSSSQAKNMIAIEQLDDGRSLENIVCNMAFKTEEKYSFYDSLVEVLKVDFFIKD